jgi:hypothetical protein
VSIRLRIELLYPLCSCYFFPVNVDVTVALVHVDI